MINKNIKFIPFLLILIIILILNINNQKENTKLKLIIWETPSSSLGNYIAISTATGFLISFIVTSNLVEFNQSNLKPKIKYKSNNKLNNSNFKQDVNINNTYDNTLIERDIKDPLPTVNANFRVIGNTSRKSQAPQDLSSEEEESSDTFYNSFSQYDNEEDNHEKENRIDDNQNDWDDKNFLNW